MSTFCFLGKKLRSLDLPLCFFFWLDNLCPFVYRWVFREPSRVCYGCVENRTVFSVSCLHLCMFNTFGTCLAHTNLFSDVEKIFYQYSMHSMHDPIRLKIKDIGQKKKVGHLNLCALFRVSSGFSTARKTLPRVQTELHQNVVKM